MTRNSDVASAQIRDISERLKQGTGLSLVEMIALAPQIRGLVGRAQALKHDARATADIVADAIASPREGVSRDEMSAEALRSLTRYRCAMFDFVSETMGWHRATDGAAYLATPRTTVRFEVARSGEQAVFLASAADNATLNLQNRDYLGRIAPPTGCTFQPLVTGLDIGPVLARAERLINDHHLRQQQANAQTPSMRP